VGYLYLDLYKLDFCTRTRSAIHEFWGGVDSGRYATSTRQNFEFGLLPIRRRKIGARTDMFVTREKVESERLGPGEDVFMVGRFVDHDGGPVNKPAVRFGNISVMPTAIEQPTKTMADAFCIDVHSRSGYSGSPVFVYRTPGYDLEPRVAGSPTAILTAGVNYLGLLGIHFSQFKELWEVTEQGKSAENAFREPLITTGKYIQGLSGMTCVLPAWTILEILNLPKLKRLRAEHERSAAAIAPTQPPETESARPVTEATRTTG
jgi:hypothetical protein